MNKVRVLLAFARLCPFGLGLLAARLARDSSRCLDWNCQFAAETFHLNVGGPILVLSGNEIVHLVFDLALPL